jgi:nucleoside-diphosphate-sugar epimerase
VYGDGSQTRSFYYVDVFVEGLRSFIRAEELAGEEINFSCKDEITMETLAESFLEVYEIDSVITDGPRPKDDPPGVSGPISRWPSSCCHMSQS